MNDQSPFDRSRDATGGRDANAKGILVGMGVVGIILLILVLPPISLLSGGSKKSPNSAANPSNVSQAAAGKSAKNPDGFELLSKVEPLAKPKGTNGPYSLTVKLTQTVTDGRNLALYTNRSGHWDRLASATLVNNGAAVTGQVADMPANIAVLRRTATAIQMFGSLPSGTQPDPVALDVLSAIDPVDYKPAADGTIQGSPNSLPAGRGNIVPTVRASEQADIDAVNTILASPQLRDAHIAALVQLALQSGNAGIDLDYQRVNPARKADFTAFISVLSDKLHQSSKTLTISLPAPLKTGVSWDTGAYDWEELSKKADMIKMVPDPDPSTYFKRMDDTLSFLKGKVDLKKVALTLSRQSYEKGTDGLRSLPLREALTLASTIEVQDVGRCDAELGRGYRRQEHLPGRRRQWPPLGRLCLRRLLLLSRSRWPAHRLDGERHQHRLQVGPGASLRPRRHRHRRRLKRPLHACSSGSRCGRTPSPATSASRNPTASSCDRSGRCRPATARSATKATSSGARPHSPAPTTSPWSSAMASSAPLRRSSWRSRRRRPPVRRLPAAEARRPARLSLPAPGRPARQQPGPRQAPRSRRSPATHLVRP